MTMKHIIKTFCLAIGIFSTTSCSDFLDQTAPSELPQNSVFESVAYTGFAINKLYGDMAQDETYSQYLPIIWGLNSDCELVDGLGSDALNTAHNRGAMNYNVSPGWSDIAKMWDAMYGIIENANLTIDGIEKSPLIAEGNENRTTMLRYKGEALTIRAMIYFDLIRIFGDIPMKMEPSQSDLSNVYLSKTDRDEIMDRLIADLEEAIGLLPWAGQVSDYTTERVTKGYAHALLANIALTRSGWMIREKAKEGYVTAEYSDAVYPTQRCDDATRKKMYELALQHLSAIITNGTHKLNPSVENEWLLLNQRTLDNTYHENIFEIPMGMGATGELGYTVGVRMNGNTSLGHNSSGKMKLTAPYLYSFHKGDQRRDITCANFDIRQTDGTAKEQLLGNSPFGIYVGKWDVRKFDNELANLVATYDPNSKWMSGINVVRMRYPQVLLMYAEVMNELAGPTGSYTNDAGITAQEALAQVHNRSFANPETEETYLNTVSRSKEDFFNAIVDENAWELAGEGFRKYDLIRWNLLVDKIIEFKQTYISQVNDGTYQSTLYFNYTDDSKTTIDASSITYYGIPEGMSKNDFQGSRSSWGRVDDTQMNTNLPSISSGLVGNSLTGSKDAVSVKNRYLLPIASTTISASNGVLYNSYGYSN